MKSVYLFIALLFLSFIGRAQDKIDYSGVIEVYKSKIAKVVESQTVQGMAIALVDGNTIIWTENFGYADFDNKIKADSTTIYGVGSVSKLFTGTAIMQLQDKYKLDIDKPIAVYSPEFKIKSRFETTTSITARLVLDHHSGLPSDIASGVFSMEPKPFNSIIELVEKEYSPYPPNYIYSYSNIGYSLLGMIIENVSGKTYEDYLKSSIFKPLGMTSACLKSDNSLKFSKGYDENGDLREEYGIRPVPAGAIKSNIKDMAKFTRSFLPGYTGTKILKAATINEMLTQQNKNSPLDFNQKYGLTWHFERVNSAGQIYHHTGGTLNHRSLVAIAPESDLGVVILSNSVKSGRFHGIVMSLLDTCAIIKGAAPYKSQSNPITKPEALVFSDTELAAFTGLYANSMFVLEVGIEDKKLTTNIQGNKYLLTPLRDGSFLPQIVLPENKLHTLDDARIEFEQVEGQVLLIYHSLGNDNKQILGSKFEPQEISPVWQTRVGTYVVTEANEADFAFLGTFELAIENEIMVLKIMEEYEGSVMWNPAIQIKDDHVAFPLGLGRHRGSTLLFEPENGDEILWYSGYRLKKVED